MRNRYESHGDVTTIFLRRKDGNYLEALIDTADLDKVAGIDARWHATWCKESQTYYVAARDWSNGGKKLYLHRLIIDAPNDLDVDHIDHNGLDNQRLNLRLATNGENQQNRLGPAASNRTSGVLGVYWHTTRRRWCVNLTVDRRKVYIGKYRHLEDAKAAVDEAKVRLYPFSQEALAGSPI
ncbi:MAG: AP2 domain-containing protein [Dehalococcoidia bacterium]|nr:AP2 domain-containing protein [Dehalococcoidia bacterium]